MLGLSYEQESSFYLTPKFPAPPREVKSMPAGGDEQLNIVVNSQPGDLPSILLFHDSFYKNACMSGLMELHFSRTASIRSSIDVQEYIRLIREEDADIVVIEFVERTIEQVLNHFKAGRQ
jgi:hypothetical protein